MMYKRADRYPVKNNKTGQHYTVVGESINCTNSAKAGQVMMLYHTRGVPDDSFCREKEEFEIKFTKVVQPQHQQEDQQ